MNNANEFLFRCSSLGKIMTNPQGKGIREKILDAEALIDKLTAEVSVAKPTLKTTQNKLAKIELLKVDLENLKSRKDEVNLSLTCRNYLIDLYVETTYGRKKDLFSKYLEKGLLVEDDSLTLLSLTEKVFFEKNNVRLSNDYVSGEPDTYIGQDIFRASVVYDTKSSWDLFTFSHSKYDDEINQDYYWQLQGYSDLTGAATLKLAYCLVNTPESLINAEMQKLWHKLGQPQDDFQPYYDGCRAIQKALTYDDIPKSERIKIFTIDRDEDAIERMHQRVLECRHYMNQTFFNHEIKRENNKSSQGVS